MGHGANHHSKHICLDQLIPTRSQLLYFTLNWFKLLLTFVLWHDLLVSSGASLDDSSLKGITVLLLLLLSLLFQCLSVNTKKTKRVKWQQVMGSWLKFFQNFFYKCLYVRLGRGSPLCQTHDICCHYACALSVRDMRWRYVMCVVGTWCALS